MAHFAELDENNIVLRVIAIHNNELLDENENEIEQKGIDFCTNLFGGVWKQTSYNGNFRKQYAGFGFHYDSTRDEFVAPQPYPSWSLSEENNWIPPKPKPTDVDFCYHWDESLQEWQK
jgi:hypothetical protein